MKCIGRRHDDGQFSLRQRIDRHRGIAAQRPWAKGDLDAIGILHNRASSAVDRDIVANDRRCDGHHHPVLAEPVDHRDKGRSGTHAAHQAVFIHGHDRAVGRHIDGPRRRPVGEGFLSHVKAGDDRARTTVGQQGHAVGIGVDPVNLRHQLTHAIGIAHRQGRGSRDVAA